jgi:hypothetical protein
MTINGKHAYYGIPLTTTAVDSAWHSALHISTSMTKQFKADFDKDMASRSFINMKPRLGRDAPGAGVDVWSVTLNIIYASVPYATQLYPIFQKIWNDKYGSTYTIQMNTLSGNVQLLSVDAPQGVSLPQVHEAVNFVASQAIAANLNPQVDILPLGSRLAAESLLPQVDVKFSTIVLSPSSGSSSVANGR